MLGNWEAGVRIAREPPGGGPDTMRLRLPHLDLRDFAKRYTAAWCSQKPNSVAAFFSKDGSLRVNDHPPAVGRHAISEVARSFMTAFPDLTVVMDDLVVRIDRVEYHWTLTGTNSGPGVPMLHFRSSGSQSITVLCIPVQG